jgi:signal transduction histidine kinase
MIVGAAMRDFIDVWPSTFKQLPSQMEVEAVRTDGQQLPLQISVSEFLNAEGKLIAILHDLTASKQAEQERLQLVRQTESLRSQQMATLAQLATGVAHEIRNPLTSIKMLIQVNRLSFAEAGLPTDDLELVEQEIRRMERSIRDLLDYARPEKGEFKPLILQDVIRRTVQLIQRQCAAQCVEITLELPESPVTLVADASQIHQLLLNLCLNALDAMKFGGQLCIAMTSHASEVALTVSDSGPGIEPEIFDRIFDPFVTSKSSGIGLGLGICRRIAEAHRGTLNGTNSPHGGAEFRLTLPINLVPSRHDVSTADLAYAEAVSN